MINLSYLHKNSEYKDKPIMIMGLARSGFAALRALRAENIVSFVYDDNTDTREKAEEYGAIWLEKPLDFDFSSLAFLMLAPGVPLYYPKPHPICEKARAANCPIISDIELFGLAKKDNSIIIGITGTNGKSTTTVLAEHVLRIFNKETICGGNIGVPVLDLPDINDNIYVLELSSFQLDLCLKFRPDISILLNISPDHLDRHRDMNGYIKAKSIMFDGCETAIIVSDDEYSQKLVTSITANNIIETTFKQLPVSLEELPHLTGEHNAQNITAVYHLCKIIVPDMSDELFRTALKTFDGLEHRQEIIPTTNNNLLFINDSKATNTDATAVALDTYSNIYWIAGGQAKNLEDFDALIKDHSKNIRHAFLIGESANDLEQYFIKYNISFHRCDLLEIALNQAVKIAEKEKLSNSSIVFSPACSSFDQFLNFEKRGDAFRELVLEINKKQMA